MKRARTSRQRGGVTLLLIMVLIVLAALVGALAVRGATGELRQAGSQRAARTGFYCAEAGLNFARPLVGANPADWNTILAGGSTAWYPPTSSTNPCPAPATACISRDIDNDNKPDFTVVIVDNFDELPPTAPNPQRDNDLTVIMVSTCVSTTLEANGAQRVLKQIVTYAGNGGTDYRYQAGHSSTHSGNEN